jgi:hypothetical protein
MNRAKNRRFYAAGRHKVRKKKIFSARDIPRPWRVRFMVKEGEPCERFLWPNAFSG